MAIYTRFGTEVKLVSADVIPVWIERKPGEIKWHLEQPAKHSGDLEETPIWFASAISVDGREGHYPKGDWILDGKGVCINDFRADGGIKEIVRACEDLNPDHMHRLSEWNKPGSGEASELFSRGNADQLVY